MNPHTLTITFRNNTQRTFVCETFTVYLTSIAGESPEIIIHYAGDKPSEYFSLSTIDSISGL